MKNTSALLTLALTLTGLLLAGCSSSPKPRLSKSEATKVNWTEKVGHYTYDEALADLGKPEVVGESAGGRTAEWVLRRSPRMSFGFGVGGASYGGGSGVGVGVGSSVSPPPRGENLRLVFDSAGQLKEWTKLTY